MLKHCWRSQWVFSNSGSCIMLSVSALRRWNHLVFNFSIIFLRLVSDQWKNMSKALMSAGHSLVAVQDNLIDAIWTDRPERPSTQLRALGLEYTGQWVRTLDRRSVALSPSMCCWHDKRLLMSFIRVWCDRYSDIVRPWRSLDKHFRLPRYVLAREGDGAASQDDREKNHLVCRHSAGRDCVYVLSEICGAVTADSDMSFIAVTDEFCFTKLKQKKKRKLPRGIFVRFLSLPWFQILWLLFLTA